jgi:hypothetical protein
MFRVWDEKDKEYLDPDYYEGFYMSPDGVVHAGITEWNGICDEYQEIPQKQLIVEQCTGLKDKNGELIFEGDVLLFNGSQNPVYFDDGSFVILHARSVFVPIKQKITEVFEIIGNIHEYQFREVTKKMEKENE